jgi:hypothetical protein
MTYQLWAYRIGVLAIWFVIVAICLYRLNLWVSKQLQKHRDKMRMEREREARLILELNKMINENRRIREITK